MRLVWYILLLVGLFSFNTFKVLTNDAYYPTYKGLSDVFGHFFRWVVLILIGSDKTNFTFRHFLIKILSDVMGIIIYLEIIQLNFCGFNKKTRKEITIRTFSDISIDSIIPMIDTEKENKEIKDENINYENKENEDLF